MVQCTSRYHTKFCKEGNLKRRMNNFGKIEDEKYIEINLWDGSKSFKDISIYFPAVTFLLDMIEIFLWKETFVKLIITEQYLSVINSLRFDKKSWAYGETLQCGKMKVEMKKGFEAWLANRSFNDCCRFCLSYLRHSTSVFKNHFLCLHVKVYVDGPTGAQL